MPNEAKKTDVQPEISDTPIKKGGTESTSDPSPKPLLRKRKDKTGLHCTRHGILSRPLLESLVRRGENLRQLRKMEHALWEDLQPQGVLAEMLFDRMWSNYLRCLLIVRSEARVLTVDRPPQYVEIDFPGIPKLERPSFSFDDVSLTHLQHLALIQRYDAHFSRDFFRTMALLVAMRDGGKAGLTRQLEKTIAKNKDEPTE